MLWAIYVSERFYKGTCKPMFNNYLKPSYPHDFLSAQITRSTIISDASVCSSSDSRKERDPPRTKRQSADLQ